MAETLNGIIERVTFRNPDNGFTVLSVRARGRRELVKVVGTLANAMAGEHIEAAGNWVVDREFGEQFKADQMRSLPPATAEGIEKYLGSGLVKGIGPVFARKIVAAFGERTLTIIDESPAFLREVKGIGLKRIQRIRDSWQQQKAVRGIMVFLQSNGLGTGRAVRIYKTYGDDAVALVRANPYRLATDIWGIGFKTADELAGRMGIDRQSPLRARAALRYVLQQLSQEGHVAFPEAGVLEKTAELTDIPREVVADAIEQQRQEGELVRETNATETLLYLKPLFLAEMGVARSLSRLNQGHPPLPEVNLGNAIAWVEKKMGLELAPSQREAIGRATRNKILVITGGPGVGKSTIVKGIVDIFSARKMRCGLCAPTGRAAKRLAETTGHEAKTIHRLLEFDPSFGGFQRDANRPLDVDLLVVDEASMVDVVLMYQLLKAVPAHSCLILVGDVDQLPSVGPGLVLADIIASGIVPVARLTQVFRQAGQSWIVRGAHAVNQGMLPESAPPGKGDFYFVETNDPETILQRVTAMVRERIPASFGLDPLRDIQVLTPMHRSALGGQALNVHLQQVLNPPAANKTEVQRFGWRFRVGDKVVQTQNNYPKQVFNGDIGRIDAIDEVEHDVVVDFEGRKVTYDYDELDEVSLAYALTIHKAQGSEYPAVVIPLHTQHYLLLQRNLLYTALTRGKKLVAVVGSRKALEMAVQRRETTQRCSLLKERLKKRKDDSEAIAW